MTTQLYDKHDSFGFAIINFPFLCSNIPLSPSYGGISPSCFEARPTIDKKLMLQGNNESCLKSSFRKFYGSYNDFVCDYKLSLAHMLNDLFHILC
jgi:hypothetical protein